MIVNTIVNLTVKEHHCKTLLFRIGATDDQK